MSIAELDMRKKFALLVEATQKADEAEALLVEATRKADAADAAYERARWSYDEAVQRVRAEQRRAEEEEEPEFNRFGTTMILRA